VPDRIVESRRRLRADMPGVCVVFFSSRGARREHIVQNDVVGTFPKPVYEEKSSATERPRTRERGVKGTDVSRSGASG
jgi:hypothetical protein